MRNGIDQTSVRRRSESECVQINVHRGEDGAQTDEEVVPGEEEKKKIKDE